MTRESQIREEAKKTTGLFSFRNGYSTAEDAFVAGAKWADNNPAQQARKVHPIIRNALIILAFIALFFAILYLIPSFAYLSFNFRTWDAAIRATIGLISLFGGIITGFFVIIELDDTFTGKGMRCPAG